MNSANWPAASRTEPVEESSLPVSILMERRMAVLGQWQYPKWQATGILTCQQVAADRQEKILVHAEDGCEQYIWHGFSIVLHKDSAESYWYNLTGKFPSLFVICHADEKGELEPFCVTANYDEAGAHMEADDPVFSLPIPPDIYQWLEHYIVENHIPQEKKKRKRSGWKQESAFDKHTNTGRR